MENNITHLAELKIKHKEYFQKVRNFVNEFDPCGFIELGAPIDEYDCLTNHLISATLQGKTRVEIKELILFEIEHHFEFPDLKSLIEPYKSKFYNDIELLIDKLENQIMNQNVD